MAIYRSIQMTFWTDSKVVDDFTPEDKYFYLYLMTNPHTNLCGCYEISMKQASDETGYSKDTIERLINRMCEVHKVIKFCKETKEILIINWNKYNWTKSLDFKKALVAEIQKVKNPEFMRFLEQEATRDETVLGGSGESPDTTVTVINNNKINKKNIKKIKDIINYLNLKTNSKYRPQTIKTQEVIMARLREGYTVNDFMKVIDVKTDDWTGTKYEKFLRPETLFGNKFEGYVNQKNQVTGAAAIDIGE